MISDIYIVDDDRVIRHSLESLLADEDYRPSSFVDVKELTGALSPDSCGVLLLDIAMPGEDGLSFLERCAREYPLLGVIMITGEATIDRAVAATRLGAFDFLEKPLGPERLLLTIRNLIEHLSLKQQVAVSRCDEAARYRIIGKSKAITDLLTKVKRIATTDSTVLILAENGTGKELVAYQVWAQGKRQEQPYITVNCAALPVELAEAELFGYRKGAFTGADRNREGKFKAAHRGTIFLDEIGDLTPAIQAKLLRILENGELEPLGADTSERVDVRLIAATNRDLTEQIRSGHFREDLFYRLNVVPLEVPPLRERREDIPLLVDHFAGQLAVSTGLGRKRFSADAVGFLAGLDYRGNVRELRNIVERSYIMSRGDTIDVDELRSYLTAEYEGSAGEEPGTKNVLTQAVRNFEKSYLATELERYDRNISKLARSLGLDRGNLSRKLKGYDLL